MKTETVKIESSNIEYPVINEQYHVAIKPVCEIVEIDSQE